VKFEIEKQRYRDRGIVFDLAGVKHAGPFAYFVQESTSSTCFVFRSFFGDTSKGRPDNIGDQGSYGNVCYPSSERTAGALEAEMLALLGRVRFDDGAINRARDPGIVTPTVANKTATSTFTLSRGVLSGRAQKLDFMYSVNPDCSTAGYPTVHVIKPPAHGMAMVEQGDDYTSFDKNNQRYECNLHRSPGTLVRYRSDAGFSGEDAVAIETIFPSGNVKSTRYDITVK
jgi:hypothetical protein